MLSVQIELLVNGIHTAVQTSDKRNPVIVRGVRRNRDAE
jgi:hypothetical protein